MDTGSARRITIDGRLDQGSAAGRLVDSEGWFDGQQSLIIDLAQVERADSAGAALLLAWQRRAIATGVELDFIHIPASIRAIVDISGLASVLPINDHFHSDSMHHD